MAGAGFDEGMSLMKWQQSCGRWQRGVDVVGSVPGAKARWADVEEDGWVVEAISVQQSVSRAA